MIVALAGQKGGVGKSTVAVVLAAEALARGRYHRARMLRPILVLGLLATTACGVNTGFLHDATSDQSIRYEMRISSVRYVRSVSGQSSVPSLVCVVPLGGGLYHSAMAELNVRAHLQTNEVLKNIRTDDDPSCYVIFGLRNLTISADVYEVTPVDDLVTSSAVEADAPTVRPMPASPPEARPERDCLDDGSCSTGRHCVFTSGARVGVCRSIPPGAP